MAVDDVYRVTITATGQGSIYQNVYAVQAKFPGDPTTAQFSNFVSQAAAIWTPVQATSVVYTEWTALQLWGSGMTVVANECRRDGARQFGDVISATAGAVPGEALPPQSAAVITWTSGFSGRRRRGRTYGFGLAETVQADGLLTSSVLTGLNTRLVTFTNLYKDDTGTSPDWTLVVWSERTASGCIPGPKPPGGHIQVDPPHPELATTPVKGYVMRPTVYSQRRRTRGVGR
jgi:hypothetical protein